MDKISLYPSQRLYFYYKEFNTIDTAEVLSVSDDSFVVRWATHSVKRSFDSIGKTLFLTRNEVINYYHLPFPKDVLSGEKSTDAPQRSISEKCKKCAKRNAPYECFGKPTACNDYVPVNMDEWIEGSRDGTSWGSFDKYYSQFFDPDR